MSRKYTINGEIIENGDELIALKELVLYQYHKQDPFTSYKMVVSDLPDASTLCLSKVDSLMEEGCSIRESLFGYAVPRYYSYPEIKVKVTDNMYLMFEVHQDLSLHIVGNHYRTFKDGIIMANVHAFTTSASSLYGLKAVTSKLYALQKLWRDDYTKQLQNLTDENAGIQELVDRINYYRRYKITESVNFRQANTFWALKEVLKGRFSLPDSKQRKEIRRNKSKGKTSDSN